MMEEGHRAASWAQFEKGEEVLYLDKRTGQQLPGVVEFVDHTVQPPSYGVRIPSLDNVVRETVGSRLTKAGEAAAAPAAAGAPSAQPASKTAPAAAGPKSDLKPDAREFDPHTQKQHAANNSHAHKPQQDGKAHGGEGQPGSTEHKRRRRRSSHHGKKPGQAS